MSGIVWMRNYSKRRSPGPASARPSPLSAYDETEASVIFSGALARLYLQGKRQCPKCGEKQKVPQSQRRETVPCKNCGEPIPPPEPSN
jgi:hypothetical protein